MAEISIRPCIIVLWLSFSLIRKVAALRRFVDELPSYAIGEMRIPNASFQLKRKFRTRFSSFLALFQSDTFFVGLFSGNIYRWGVRNAIRKIVDNGEKTEHEASRGSFMPGINRMIVIDLMDASNLPNPFHYQRDLTARCILALLNDFL